jgi:hypothetical protein
MPTNVTIGQRWSTWAPSRRQWLLSTVTRQEHGEATLKYDSRYGMPASDDEQKADEATMLTSSNLFRFVEP